MKTDDLIDLLVADKLPVRRHVAATRLAAGLLVAVPASGLLMASLFGVNPALREAATLPMFWVKLCAPLLMAAAALPLVARLGRPGASTRGAWLGWALPVAVLWVLAGIEWLQAPAADAAALVLGRTWRVCALNIVVLSVPVFVAAMWVLKSLAPVRLASAGAGAGALAGAAGAGVYALHCPEFGAAFIAVWYVLGIAACVALGALAGPKVLRW